MSRAEGPAKKFDGTPPGPYRRAGLSRNELVGQYTAPVNG